MQRSAPIQPKTSESLPNICQKLAPTLRAHWSTGPPVHPTRRSPPGGIRRVRVPAVYLRFTSFGASSKCFKRLSRPLKYGFHFPRKFRKRSASTNFDGNSWWISSSMDQSCFCVQHYSEVLILFGIGIFWTRSERSLSFCSLHPF